MNKPLFLIQSIGFFLIQLTATAQLSDITFTKGVTALDDQ